MILDVFRKYENNLRGDAQQPVFRAISWFQTLLHV